MLCPKIEMKNTLQKAAWALAVLVVLLVVSIYLSHVQAKNPAQSYKEQLRAAGEKLTIEELIPPRVPAEQNGADLLRQAAALATTSRGIFDKNPPPAMRMIAPGKATIGWQRPDIRNEGATNSWEDAYAMLEYRAGELELLQKLIERPALDFELDYKKGFKLLLPHLARLKGLAQLLSEAAICDLHRGDTSSPVTNTRAMLAIAKGWKDERLVISQLVRIAIVAITLPPTWELLQSTNVTDEQLATLQRDWQELEFIHAAEQALQMERAMGIVTFAQMRNSRDPANEFYGMGPSGSSGSSGFGDWLEDLKGVWTGTKRHTALALRRASWSYTDELRALQGQQALIETLRQIQTNGFFQHAMIEQERQLKALGFGSAGSGLDQLWEKLDEDGLRRLFSQSVESLARFMNRLMSAEAAKQVTVAAIALKRYHLRHGNFPPDLAALVPEFLPAVPVDPVDGHPLRYQTTTNGFLLYSVGEDKTDSGGDPAPSSPSKTFYWQKGRDWVWPQPANEKEIEMFEAAAGRR